MRQYINKFLVLALSTFTLASCNDDFDEDFNYSYPQELTLGTWTASGIGGKSYTVNMTEDAQGKMTCDIIEFIPSVGVTNVLAGGSMTYSKNTGTLHVEYPSSPYGNNSPAVADLGFLKDGKTVVGSISEKTAEGLSQKGMFTALPSDTLSVSGTWNFGENGTISLFSDYTGSVKVGDTEEKASYIQEGNQAIVVTPSKKYVLSVNNKKQVVLTLDGKEEILTRVSDYVDDWQVIATGTYFNGLGQQIPARDLKYSPSRRQAVIVDFFGKEGTELGFYWNINQPFVIPTSADYETKTIFMNYVDYGFMHLSPKPVEDLGGYTAFFSAQDGAFIFSMEYSLPQISLPLGLVMDYFFLD